MSKVRVVVADDHEMMREGLTALISAEADMEVIGEAHNGRVAVALAQALHPDIVVMDVSMPVMNGLKATEQIRALCAEVKVLTLTRHTDDSYLQQLLRAGASGYVLKKSASAELVRAIRAIVAGHAYLDAEMTASVIEISAGRPKASGPAADTKLSTREEEVLRYTAWGYANTAIAERLSISVRTVEVHKANGMRKQRMRSRIDIVRYALLRGWLQDS
jgi:DNA-binding NarL/FixJ family response regulator